MWTYKYIMYTVIAVVLTFIVHEFTHWTVGELFGYEMRMTLNVVYPVAGKYDSSQDYAVISFVGPMITLLQAVVFYLLIKKYSTRNLYPFLLMCCYLELLSGIMNYRHTNDLGRVGQYLNIGLFTLPILFTAFHCFLNYKTIKRNKYEMKFFLTTLFFVILFSSIWILTNQKYRVILI